MPALQKTAAAAALVALLGGQQPVAIAANEIVTDGKTGTTLAVNGDVTDISTATYSSNGNIGFNSFSKFNIDTGKTVNLQLGAANNLINIVNDTQRSTIYGTLNSIKNSAIGGHLYFLNPNGLLVGTSGSINVGSFTALTPSATFIQGFTAAGRDAFGQTVLSGTYERDDSFDATQDPFYPGNGTITIEGKVNAINDITLKAGKVEVAAGGLLLSGADFTSNADFSSVVNTNGWEQGTAFAANNGKISIVGQSTQLVQDEASGYKRGLPVGGTVTVNGNIRTGGGSFEVNSGSGSAALTGEIRSGGGAVNAKADTVNLGGKVSTLGGDLTAEGSDITLGGTLNSGGGDIAASARKSVTVGENAVLSTRQISDEGFAGSASTGDSGSLTLTSKPAETGVTAQIDVKSGARLYSFADNGKTGGDITLTADNTTQLFAYAVTGPAAKITVDSATLKGRNVTIEAIANNDQLMDPNDPIVWFGDQQSGEEPVEGDSGASGLNISDYTEKGVDLLGNIRLGVAFMDATAKADVILKGNTQIDAGDKVDITADATSTAQATNFSSTAAVAVGISDAHAQVSLGDTAADTVRIKSGGDVAVQATTNNKVSLSNTAMNLIPVPIDIAVSVGIANSDASARLGTAAAIDSGGKVAIGSTATKTMNLSTASSGDQDIAGAAVSISLSNTKADTSIAGDITAAGQIDIGAAAQTGADSATLAKSIVGDSFIAPITKPLMNKTGITKLKNNIVGGVKNFLGIKASTEKGALDKLAEKAGFNAATAIDLHDNTVTAAVKDGAKLISTGSGINVDADLADRVKISSTAQQNPFTNESGQTAKKDLTLAVGLVYGDHDNTVKAQVGKADLDAKDAINITADNTIPLDVNWSKLLGIGTLSANLGLQDAVFSTWAQSAAKGEKTAAAGSLDFLFLDNATEASVADSAKINQSAGYGAGDLKVAAYSEQQTTNIAGVLGGIFTTIKPEMKADAWFGSSAGESGVGGSVVTTVYSNDTKATIGNAAVKANNIDVDADTLTKNVVVSVSGGASDDLAVDVSLASANTKNTTKAQIGDGATVSAGGDVAVKADDDAQIIDTAGGVAKGGNTGIGASVSVNTLIRDTQAILGHTANQAAAATAGSLTAGGNLLLDAQNTGDIISASLAAAVQSPAPPKTPDTPAADGTPDADDPLDGISLPMLFGDGSEGAAPEKPKSGKAIAGDVAVNIITDDAYAGVKHAGAITAKNAAVDAQNSSDILAVAGSAAIATGADSTGIAGTATVNVISNETRAEISGEEADKAVVKATGSGTDDAGITVKADNASTIKSIAASGSGAVSGTGTGLAGQVTVNVIDGETKAAVSQADLRSEKDITVKATDANDILSVGGAVALGGKTGIGASVSVNAITNDTLTALDSSAADAKGDIGITAEEKSKIIAVGASVGGSKSGMAAAVSLAGAGVANATQARIKDSTVAAKDSVLLEAAEAAEVINAAGAAGLSLNQTGAGGALSVVVVKDDTAATVENSTVTALGNGDGATARKGLNAAPLRELPDWTTIGGSSPSAATETIHGLAVNAVSDEQLVNIAAGFGGGGSVGLGGSITVNTVVNTTKALVDGSSKINESNTGANAAQSVLVRASQQAALLSGAGAVGVGKSSGVGVGIDTGVITLDTQAGIADGAVINAADTVAVNAAAEQDILSIVAAAGVGAGSAGVAGAGGVHVIDSDTAAYIGAGQGSDVKFAQVAAGGNVSIGATDNTTLNQVAGGVGIGSSAGVAGAVGVSVVNKDTQASIGEYSRIQANANKGAIAAGTGSFSAAGNDAFAGLLESYSPELSENENMTDQQKAQLTAAGRSRSLAENTVNVKGVAVTASAQDVFRSVVVSVGGGGTAAVTGSGSASVYNNTTTARVADHAQINQNNAAAGSEQSVHIAAGTDYYRLGVAGAVSGAGTAGVGGGAGVNVTTNTVEARIGDSAKVAAKQDVGVTARAVEQIIAVAAAGSAAGTVGVSGAANIDVLNLTTKAAIGSNATVAADGNVFVGAKDDTDLISVAGSAGLGVGAAGVGGSVHVNVLNKNTDAGIGGNASVEALGQKNAMTVSRVTDTGSVDTKTLKGLAIEAVSSEDILDVAASGGVGLYAGVAGAVSVNVLDAATAAHIDAGAKINQSSGAAADQSVNLAAINRTDLFSLSSSLGAGAAGVAGAVDIGLLSANTSASIGNSTKVSANKDIAIQALTDKDTGSYALSGGLGAGGVAGSLSLYGIGAGLDQSSLDNLNSDKGTVQGDVDKQVQGNAVSGMLGQYGTGNQQIADAGAALETQTKAIKVGDKVKTAIPGGTSAVIADNATVKAGGALDLTALSLLDHTAKTGGLAVGGATIGGAVGIALLDNDAAATLGKGVEITAGQALAVQASLKQAADIDAYAVSGSMAGSLGAAVALIHDDSGITAGSLNSGSTDRAQISGNTVSVKAGADNDFDALAVNGTLSFMGPAVGASVADVKLNGTTNAGIGKYNTVNSGGALTVVAETQNDAKAEAYGGSAGGLLGLGASVALANDSQQTKASIGDQTIIEKAGTLTLSADRDSAVEAKAIGAAAGGFAGAGAAVATAGVTGDTAATTGTVEIGRTSGKTVTKAELKATTKAEAKSRAVAGAAGLGAGAGAVATAAVGGNTQAVLGAESKATTTGAIDIQAIGQGTADADATGISAGAASVGASVATAKNTQNMQAGIGKQADIAAGTLNILAQQALINHQDTAKANAVSAAGGLLLGVNATVATAAGDNTVTAELGEGVTVNVSGSGAAVNLQAKAATQQTAEAFGVGAGFIGAGASVAKATSDSDTSARTGAGGNITGSSAAVTVGAETKDDNYAETVAGSGGVVAGAAAVAGTKATGTTEAIMNADVAAKRLSIKAERETIFNAVANGVNASLLGGSGIVVDHTVDTDVLAKIGENTVISTQGDTTLQAVNTAVKDWKGTGTGNGDAADWNIQAAGGGVVNGAAVDVDIDIDQTATVQVGKDAKVTAGQGATRGDFAADAQTSAIVREKAKINTGGAIAVADVDSRINAEGDAKVDIGGNAKITSDTGQIKAGTKNNADLDNRVAADAYGLAGVPAGTAYSNFTGSNRVNIAQNAKLTADGDISLAAGQDTSGAAGTANANAVVNLWNKTVVPINTKPNPQANIVSNSTLTVDGYAGSATDIYLTADKGAMNASYTGVGKDLYREALAAIGSAISNLFGGGDVNLDIKGGSKSTAGAATVSVSGTVETGLKRVKTLSFGGSYQEDGNGGYKWVIDPAASEGVTYTTEYGKAIAESMTDRLNELYKLKAAYAGDANAVAAYEAEILFLQEKMVSMGLAAWQGSGADRVFVPGTSAGTGALSPKASAQAALDQMKNLKEEVDTNVAAQTPVTASAKTYRDLVQARDSAKGILTEKTTALTNAQNTLNNYVDNTSNFSASEKPSNRQEALDKRAALTGGTTNPLYDKYTQAIQYYDAVSTAQTEQSTAQTGVNNAKTAITTANSSWNPDIALSTVQTAYQTEQTKLDGYLSQQTSFAGSISDLTDLIPTLSDEVPSGPTADYITVNPITARLGDIRVTADNLTGTGTLKAPGDAKISITNNSPAFLTVQDLTVRDGGSIYFNGASVKDNAGINALNSTKAGAAFGQVTTKANSPLPTVTVTSTFNPNAAENKRLLNGVAVALAMAPDITLAQGSVISNINGPVAVHSNYGNIYSNGSISAGTVDIEAANGDFVQSYVNGFNHIGGDPEKIYGTDGTDGLTPGGITANGNIFISARYLNVNGLIQSGIADWALTLSNDVRVSVNGSSKTLAEAEADYQTHGGTGLYTVVGGYYGNIGDKGYVTYDAANHRFEVGGVEVHGGLVQLYGQIINTAKNGASTGKIRALDGYGTINITNNSGKDIVLQNLNTGDGSAGVIDITDTGRGVHTVYKSDRGVVTVTENDAVKNKADYNYSSGGGRATMTYSPQSNLYYNWTTGTDYSFTQYYHYESDDVFGYTVDTSVGPQGTPTYSNYGVETPLVNGIYLSNGRPFTASDTLYYADNTYTINTSTGVYNKIREWTTRRWWTFGIWGTYYQDYSITTPKKNITTYSVKASNPIGIEFFGQNNGTVSVSGNSGNVLLQGTITNKEGNTSISTGKDIVQADSSALITTANLALDAGGSVGSDSQAIRAVIGDTLTASAGSGGVNVTQVLGDLKLGAVTADNGTLRLTADGSIVNAASSDVRGQRVELISSNGGIGASNAPLLIKTGRTDDYLNAAYGLKATALNDINIENKAWTGKNAAGDLLIDTVESRTGDVTLTTPGRMIDNNTDEQIDQRTWNELTNYWDSLQLRAGTADNEAKQAQELANYVNGKNNDYRTYWQLQSRIVDGQYVFADSEQAALAAQGIDAAGFAAEQLAKYQSLADSGVGSWNGGQYDAAFTYAITADERTALLKGSSWTDRELAVSLSPGALKELTDTNPVIKAPNVKGKNITLTAGQGIGSNLSNIVIDATKTPDQLTAAEKVALAAAERADLTVDNANNIITITQRKPVNVEAGGLLTATSGAFAYLGSESGVNLNYIQANGDVRLKTAGAITAAADAGLDASRYIIIGDNIILESAGGGIGTVDLPLNLGHSGTLTARAQGDIYLRQDSAHGNMKVDTIYSLGDVSLNANESIVSSDDNEEDELNIMSKSLKLKSGKTIGASDKTLHVALDEAGTLTAEAQQGINLRHSGDKLTVADVKSATGDIKLKAGSNMKVEKATAATGNIALEAGGTLQAANVTATNGSITGTAGSGLTADTLQAGVNIGLTAATGTLALNNATAAHDIALTAAAGDLTAANVTATNGSIGGTAGTDLTTDTLNAGTDINLVAGNNLTADGLNAGNDIDLTATAGSLDVKNTTAQDNVVLKATTGALQAANIAATAGGITGAVGNGLTADTLQAGVNIGLTVATGTLALNNATAAHDIALTAVAGDLTAANVTATNGSIRGAAGNNLTADGLNAGTDIDLTATAGTLDVKNAAAKNNVVLEATTGVLQAANITAIAGAITGTAGTDLTAADLEAGRNIGLTATAGTLEVNNATAADHVVLEATTSALRAVNVNATTGGIGGTAGTDLTASTLTAGADINLAAGNSLTADGLNAGNDIDLTATVGTLDVKNATAANNVALKATADALKAANIAASGSITGTAGTDIRLNGGVRTGTDQNVSLTAGGTITQEADGIITTGILTTSSGAGQTLDAANQVGRFNAVNSGSGDIVFQNASGFTAGTVEQQGSGDVTVGSDTGDIAVEVIKAVNGKATVNAYGSIVNAKEPLATGEAPAANVAATDIVLQAKTGGIGAAARHFYIDSSAADNVSGSVDAQAAKNIYLSEVKGDLNNARIVSSDGDIDLSAPDGKANLTEIHAAGSTTLGAKDGVNADRLESDSLSFSQPAGAPLQLGTLVLRDSLTINADAVTIGLIEHTGDKPLVITLQGSKDGAGNADDVRLTVTSNSGVEFRNMNADTVHITANTDNVILNNAQIGHQGDIFATGGHVVLDSITSRPVDTDASLQLLTEDSIFNLRLGTDRDIYTDATVVYYHPDYIINGGFGRENSITRQDEQGLARTGGTPAPTGSPTVSPSADLDGGDPALLTQVSGGGVNDGGAGGEEEQ